VFFSELLFADRQRLAIQRCRLSIACHRIVEHREIVHRPSGLCMIATMLGSRFVDRRFSKRHSLGITAKRVELFDLLPLAHSKKPCRPHLTPLNTKTPPPFFEGKTILRTNAAGLNSTRANRLKGIDSGHERASTMTVTSSGMLVLVTSLASAVAVFSLIAAFNRLVRRRNLVAEGKSGIDVQLKRRHELIPNLVACVQGYTGFERSLLEDLTRLREGADQASSMADVNNRETALNRGLSSFFARVEAYPELKANTSFAELSRQLVDTEDALQYSRRYYNGAVRDLNIAVEAFPSNLVAGVFGFQVADYFQVDSIAERAAPAVSLSTPASPVSSTPPGP